MNDNAKKWVAALRSGDYKQTTGTLHRRTNGRDSFCCLGVACVLAVEAGVIPPPRPEQAQADTADVIEYGELGEVAFLPAEVQDWLGMNTAIGHLGSGDLALTERNDAGDSFGCIADVIETRASDLFV